MAPTVTAVVLRGDDVLLIRRSDTLAWTPIMKILDPGEQPAAGAGREVAEETGVSVEVESLAWVRSTGLSVHMNGDEAYYLDHLFRCRYVSGTAHVADDECVDVAWFPKADTPHMDAVLHRTNRVRSRAARREALRGQLTTEPPR